MTKEKNVRIVFLDTDTLGEDMNFDAFRLLGELSLYGRTSPSDVSRRIRGAEIIVTNKVVITKEHLEENPELGLICIAATGMNNVDLEAAEEKGVQVRNVAGYSTASVVQHTVGMALTLLGRLHYFDGYVKSGAWSASGLFTHIPFSLPEVSGKRWGIIGLGAIGRGVAAVAEALGCDVVYYSASGRNNDAHFRRVGLDELLSTSLLVSVHAPLNVRTEGLLSAEKLSLLQPASCVVNVGRGGIIDEDALARIIDEKEVYAALDVYAEEPLSSESPLLTLHSPERLLLTPHIAWSSRDARLRLLKGVEEHIRAFLNAGNIP